MKSKQTSLRTIQSALLLFVAVVVGQGSTFAASLELQGQSRGSSSWIAGNLQNWRELDYIPCRVYITGGPVVDQTITISFPHLTGTTPGFEDLMNFTTSANATLTSEPTLNMAASGTWSYTFKVSVTDGNPASVNFSARLAAGAHLNTGSSLMLGGNPTSMGNLQIHKPAPGPGAPNLAIVKSGPATTSPGATITYTLSYTNKAAGTNTAYGSQISDILPAGVSVSTNNLNGGRLAGNTIFWDLGNVAPGASGQISFPAQVSANAVNGQVLTNFAQILSSEDDATYTDNSSKVTTTVIITCTPVSIVNSPLSQTNCPETPALFNVTAAGSTPISYQWRKNGSVLPNETNSSYSIVSASALDSAIYDVIVSNGCGSATSSPALFVVNTPVSATALINQTNCPGTTASFNTVASGTGPFSYAWLKNGQALSETSSTLTLNNISANDAALYSVIVSGACGSVTNSATLAINIPVSATPLVSQTNCPGTTASFTTVAGGTGPISYAWFKNGQALGQTGNMLTLNNVSSTDAGTYAVVVSGACGVVTNSATLAINTPVSATPLISQTNCPGTTVVFSTVASGTGPFSYAWLKNGQALGQAGSSITLNSVSVNDAGLYSVIVSGVCGSVTNSATLAINTAVSATPLVSQTNCPGTTVVFSTVASGTGPFSYAWLKNGQALGQTSSSLTLNNVSANDAGLYSVIVSGVCGSVTNSATLAVNTPVSATPLVSQTNCPGTTVVFGTVASGTGPFSYAWLKNGQTLGQTASSITLNSVSANDVGLYSVIVSGVCGSVTNSATLAINTAVSATPLVSQTNCPGTTVVFSTVASGTGPFSYAWLKNGQALGQTASSITLNSVSANDAGLYSVIVSGVCGSVTNSATLAINTAVSATPLVSQTNCPGTTVVFSTVASGTGPFSYAWLKNGQVLSTTGSGSGLVLSNTTAPDAGFYSVIVSGACGSVTNSATLTINTPVSATPLVSQTNCPGTTVVFSTVASGTGPFSYAWLKNGQTLGQTGSSLTLNSVSSTDAGLYSVIVSGACGSVTNSATLAISTPVSATPLLSQTNCPGTTVAFSTVASGTGPFSYAWLKNGQTLGQAGSSITLNSVSANDAGLYSVIVSGVCGSVTNSATLAINTAVSATPLVSQTNCPGTTVVFSTVASGTGPFSYAWLKNGQALGQTGSSITLNSVSANDAGLYSVIVSGACGSVTNSATLAINTPVSATPLVSQTNCPGTTVVFNTVASGTGPFSYAWLKNGQVLSTTGSGLVLSNTAAADAGFYSVIVSGACGSVTNSATLTINTPVSATPLVSQTNCPRTTVVFSTVASGTGPFSYAWLKNGQALSETSSSLTLHSVSPTDAALYSVIVSGVCGSVTNNATLAVNQETTVSAMANLVRNPGETAVFSAVASGTGPFSYVWKKNGNVLSDETASSLVLSNVTSVDDATYTVVATGSCNAAEQTASLHINVAPTVIILNPTNGAVFAAPASFSLTADAQDIDGVVTNVEFFAGTNKLGETAVGMPYSIDLSNLAAGTYTFTAKATDNGGLSATSAPVTISVVAQLPITLLNAIHFNPQTGLYEQSVRITNPSLNTVAGVRLYIYGLDLTTTVYNASGNSNGVPYVQSSSAIPAGSYIDMTIEYHLTATGVPTPTLVAEIIPANDGGTTVAVGNGVQINRALMKAEGFMLEFMTESNKTYYIQYSSDLKTWKQSQNPLSGTGYPKQWIDNGQPKTESAPSATTMRFYRVIVTP